MAKKGRPTKYNEKLGLRICDLTATHPIGYHKIRELYPELPCAQLVREWRHKFSDFNAKYLDAKRFQAEILVEDIDDMLPGDVKTYTDDRGNERIDSPSAAMLIAKLNNRKWMAARLAPRRFGDSPSVEELEGRASVLQEELRMIRAELDAKHQKEY